MYNIGLYKLVFTNLFLFLTIMKNKLILFLLTLFCYPILAQNAEIELSLDSFHPRMREKEFPLSGDVSNNPVTLLWPTINKKNVRYTLYLSQNNLLEESNIVSNTPWAMYNSHHKLAKGQWYWKYIAYLDDNKIYESPVFTFYIDGNKELFETPTIAELLEQVNKLDHPKLFTRKDKLVDFRSRNLKKKDALSIIKEAEENLNKPLIIEKPTRPRDTTGVEGFEKKVLIRFMYHKFGELIREPIDNQSLAYLLTGDEKYAKEALRQAIHAAKMDPKGHATQEDFNSASVMLAMATAYDTAFEFSTVEEKEVLRAAIKERGNYFFKQYVNKFEAQSMDNHVWQHTLRRFLMTSIAVVGDIDEANQWLSYIYEVWCSRFPILGGNDGGWHDGNSYYGVNFESFIIIPLLLKNLTGVDFFGLEWYKNAGKYLLYSFPKNSYSTGFGDAFEAMLKPSKKYISYADALANETGCKTARAYANYLVNGDLDKISKDKDFTLYRLLTESNNIDNTSDYLESLEQAAYFPDAGFAFFHSNLTKTRRNLMLSFFSLPYGATGHAHAAHNGFTISYGGKQLFGGSGYYSNFNDAHTLKHYRTRGHNTIIADGKSMVIGENGYGWLPRFYNTVDFGYVLGDATHAFGDMTSEFWLDRMQKSNVEYTLENGFGNPQIEKFRRHVVYIRPNIILLYDELEAKEPITWTWMIHSYQKMTKDGANKILGYNEFANAQVYLLTDKKQNYTSAITNEYFSPAINWKKKPVNGSLEYDKNWHTYFNSNKKLKKQRFLSVIVIDEKTKKPTRINFINNQSFKIKGWDCTFELNPSKQASFTVLNKQSDGVVYNSPKFNSELNNATLIIKNGGVQEILIDKLPTYR